MPGSRKRNVIFMVLFFVLSAPSFLYASGVGKISYAYDLNDRLQTVSYDNTAISFTYDKADNRVSRVSESFLVNVILTLQIMVDYSPDTHNISDSNGDNKIGLAEAIYLLRRAAGVDND